MERYSSIEDFHVLSAPTEQVKNCEGRVGGPSTSTDLPSDDFGSHSGKLRKIIFLPEIYTFQTVTLQ